MYVEIRWFCSRLSLRFFKGKPKEIQTKRTWWHVSTQTQHGRLRQENHRSNTRKQARRRKRRRRKEKEMRNISYTQCFLWSRTHLVSRTALEAMAIWQPRFRKSPDPRPSCHLVYLLTASQSHSENTSPLNRDYWDWRELSAKLRNKGFNRALGSCCCGLSHLLYWSLDLGMWPYLEIISKEELH